MCIHPSSLLHTNLVSSMIETSTFRHHGQSFSVDMTPINPAAPDLLAQLFWTAASLLESDYEGEYTMALRLMSRVSIGLDSPVHCIPDVASTSSDCI